ncbi:MAG: hypothetical protein ACHWZW_10315 [Spirulina sp.]
MSLFATINDLQLDQLKSVAETLGVNKAKEYQSFNEINQKSHLNARIKTKLREHYASAKQKLPSESYRVLVLWRDYVLEVLGKKTVKPENQSQRDQVVKDLKALDSKDKLNDSDLMVTVARDIFLLLWKESSDQDKDKFVDTVKKDLEGRYNRKFTEQEINNSVYYLLFGGIGGAVPIAVPLVAGVMLQQLTRGFMAWLLINVMGQKALQVAVLGALAGPIGWGIAIGTGGLSIALSLIKLGSEQEKLRFIQAILSIYTFRYQNELKERGRKGQLT